jgi:hypothetical protein
MKRVSRTRSRRGGGGQGAAWAVRLACALVVGSAALARAEEPEAELEAPAEPPWVPRWGLMVDAGVPDGLGLSGLWQPLPWLRMHTGAMASTVGYGVRGGLGLVPLRLAMSPMLELELGHALQADYDTLLERLGGQPRGTGALLSGLGYSYATAALGLEWTLSERMSVCGRVGVGYWVLWLQEARAWLPPTPDPADLSATPLHLRLVVPSGRVALLVWF